MAIAAPSPSTAISVGSREAPAFLPQDPTPQENRWPPRHPLPREFLHMTFTSPDEFRDVHLLRTSSRRLTENELSRRGEFRVARIAMHLLKDRVSEITVIGWQAKHPGDVTSQRDVSVRLQDGKEFDIEVKNGGYNTQRYFMRRFREGLPEEERNTREARNRAMWQQSIMMIVATGTHREISRSIKTQLAEIEKLAPVVVFVEEPIIDIGQLAFSGRATPDDAIKWIKQNPHG